MFNKDICKIVVVHYGNVLHYPPVMNLIDCLVTNGYRTLLLSENVTGIDKRILDNDLFSYKEVVVSDKNTYIEAAKRTLQRRKQYKELFLENMEERDIVWTTNDNAVAALNKTLTPFHNRHVLQLMELVNRCPRIKGVPFFDFPLDEYARNAWKTVVPERNRAYIQKVLWKQEKKPFVLPNKPYRLEIGDIDSEVEKPLSLIREEKRKIVLYLGVIGKDRDLSPFIDAVELLGDDYCLYIIGRVVPTVKGKFFEIVEKNDKVKYLGFFNPPKHLNFIKYAHVALLPYKPAYDIKSQSPLNALYCAPNKIFEYAGFGVPMIGTDVLGLIEPFEKYGIGLCCNDLTSSDIADAIRQVSLHHDEMSSNCIKYYESINFDDIVEDILR